MTEGLDRDRGGSSPMTSYRKADAPNVPGVPVYGGGGGLLSRLEGRRMYSVEFVVNDYVQLRFDADELSGPVTLNCYVWPMIESRGRRWREPDLGYADSLRSLTPGTVVSATERNGQGIRIELDRGAVVLDPTADEVFVEVAELMGPANFGWVVWRPGEDTFEHLA